MLKDLQEMAEIQGKNEYQFQKLMEGTPTLVSYQIEVVQRNAERFRTRTFTLVPEKDDFLCFWNIKIPEKFPIRLHCIQKRRDPYRHCC